MIIIERPGFVDEAVIIFPQSLESFHLFAEPHWFMQQILSV